MSKLTDIWLVLRGRLSSTDWEDRYDSIMNERDAVVNESHTLVQAILKTDEDIYRLSQCMNAEQMQAILGPMVDAASIRRRHVSDRIGEREIKRIKAEYNQ